MIPSFSSSSRLAITGIAALLLLGGCTADASPPLASAPAPIQREQAGWPGIVSAADPRAAEAGAEMLRAGGSATDAAIATMLALNVVEPQSSGIGGGGFYVRGDGDGEVETIDGRETAPTAATPEWFLDENGQPRPFMQAVRSGLSVGVPGNIALAAKAHTKHGKLPWAKLFEPAIRLARNGFEITGRLRQFLERAGDRAAATPEGRSLYFGAAGEPLPAGTRVVNADFAATLEAIANQGPDAFYTGDNAAKIAELTAAETPHPAGMSPSDIAQYEAKSREPVCGIYRVWRICGMGPPSSGATTVFAMLKQLEAFDLKALGKDSPVAWHLFAESQRLAYADRELYLGDADFVSVPVKGMIDGDYLTARGQLISPDSTAPSVAAGKPWPGDAPPIARGDGDEPEEHGTSHFVAIDRWGNAVSYTSTIEGSFGSGLMVGGYYLNNELTDFSFSPTKDGMPVANRVEGGKRPRSSMAPTLVYDAEGRLVIAVGAAGGATIPVQVAKTLIGMLDWDLSPLDAIALPVLYSPGDTVMVESESMLAQMIPALEALGHANVIARGMPLKTNAARRGPDGWIGAADPRSDGAAITE
jgi:gamma-glutamyltranspeptidase/glutathione hydrolase